MEYRRLGRSGLKVSAISLGAWLTYGSSRFEFDNAVACLRAAMDNGINYIDVADIYARGEAEKVVGQALKGYKRTDFVISTKAYWPMSDNINDRGLSRKHIFESVEKSLKRFEIDYIDLFFCHRWDDETPTDETVQAIDDLIRQGKILYWGTSMWSAANIAEAVGYAKELRAHRPIVEQPLYNMLDRDQVEGEVEDVCATNGIGLVVWSPLAQGVLTGKYNDGVPAGSRGDTIEWFKGQLADDRIERTRKLTALAAEVGVSVGSLALAWAMKHPLVASVITGASKPEQVLENLKALDVKITPELDERIEAILNNKPKKVKHG
jgi:voltage-dependent potassium channel beta subunit